MPKQAKQPALVFADFRGGRNGVDPPLTVGGNQCCEAYNVEFWRSTLGKKRAGATAMSLTSGPNSYYWMGAARHVPGSDDLAAELWAMATDYSTTNLHRYTTIGGWTTPSPLTGNLNSDGWYDFCSFNGKLFMAVSRPRASMGAIDYMRVWDGANLRTVGFATPAAPTAADDTTGSATARYYKVAYTTQVAGVTTRRSELSAVRSFTPSGAVGAVVTKPAALSNGETHWELYGSTASAGPYYLIATTVVGTATYTDSADPATYSSGTAAPVSGQNTRPSGHYYLATDGSRLLMAVPYTSAGVTFSSRVEWTPPLSTTDVGDDERCPPSSTGLGSFYKDLGASDGDYITGMAKKPFHNEMYIFKRRHIYKLTPTSNVASPYQESMVTGSIGCVSNDSIVQAEDAIYFMSEFGPYRLTVDGLEFIGRNCEDLMNGPGATCHTCYYQYKNQVWFNVQNGNDSTARTLVYDIRSGGWSVYSCATLQRYAVPFFHPTLTYTLIPYLFINGTFPGTKQSILKADYGSTDNGTTFQAYVKSPAKSIAGLLSHSAADEPVLVAKASAGATVVVTMERDFGMESQSFPVSLTPKGSESRVIKLVEGCGMGMASVIQVTIGDPVAMASDWSLEALVTPASALEPL